MLSWLRSPKSNSQAEERSAARDDERAEAGYYATSDPYGSALDEFDDKYDFEWDDDAPEPSAKAAEILAKYDRTGDTRTCLNINRIRQIRALDDHHFLVRANTSKYYLNITSNTCHGASRATNRLQYTTSIAQLCRNQIVRVIDNTTGIFSGSCGLGSFELLEKKVETDEDDDTQTDEGAR